VSGFKKEMTAVRQFVKRKLADNRCGHDFDHTLRVYKNALKLAELCGGNIEIIAFAAMLHDVGRAEETRSKGAVCHAETGAVISREYLEKRGFDAEFVNAVVHCIERHRFRRGLAPESLEAKILFDADKLDSIGPVGIGRAFLFAGNSGARLHNSEKEALAAEEYSYQDTAYREYLVKLSKVHERMLTAPGRELALYYTAFMKNFFKEMNLQIKGKKL
jgi:uncharacterized protein